MKLNLKITDEQGNEYSYSLAKSTSDTEKTLDDFILKALSISEDKRKLPLKILSPNGTEVYPSIKMKFENFGSSLLGDKLEAMHITWKD